MSSHPDVDPDAQRIVQPSGEPVAIGIDIGGTKIAAAIVTADGQVSHRRQTPTPDQDGPATIAAAAGLIAEVIADHDGPAPIVVGAAVAALTDSGGQLVYHSPNVGKWRDSRVAADLSAATGLPVFLENDANAAAWGEVSVGAVPDVRNLLVVTVGTGIGGGLIIDGELYRGDSGTAAEVGHLTIEWNGRPCTCGLRGCWEQYASGTALGTTARALGGDGLDAYGGAVIAAARAGEQFALDAFADCGAWLGRGLASLSSVLDPGAFIIGGGVAAAGDLLLAPAQAAFDASMLAHGYRPRPSIGVGVLGNEAGIIGAALLALRRLEGEG